MNTICEFKFKIVLFLLILCLLSCNKSNEVILDGQFKFTPSFDVFNDTKNEADVEFAKSLLGNDTLKTLPLLSVQRTKLFDCYVMVNLNFNYDELSSIILKNNKLEILKLDTISVNKKFILKDSSQFRMYNFLKLTNNKSYLFVFKGSDLNTFKNYFNNDFVNKSIVKM